MNPTVHINIKPLNETGGYEAVVQFWVLFLCLLIYEAMNPQGLFTLLYKRVERYVEWTCSTEIIPLQFTVGLAGYGRCLQQCSAPSWGLHFKGLFTGKP